MQLGSDTLSGAPADISLGNIRDRLQNTRNLRPLRLTNIMNHNDDNIMSKKMDVITFQLSEFHLSGPVTPTPRYQKNKWWTPHLQPRNPPAPYGRLGTSPGINSGPVVSRTAGRFGINLAFCCWGGNQKKTQNRIENQGLTSLLLEFRRRTV